MLLCTEVGEDILDASSNNTRDFAVGGDGCNGGESSDQGGELETRHGKGVQTEGRNSIDRKRMRLAGIGMQIEKTDRFQLQSMK